MTTMAVSETKHFGSGDHRQEDFEGKLVVLRKGVLKPDYEHLRVVIACGGFSCHPDTIGSGVFVMFSDGDEARFERYHISGYATPDEARAAGWQVTP